MSVNEQYEQGSLSNVAMVLAFNAIKDKLKQFFLRVTNELKDISARLENIENHVEFHTGAINIMLKD